MLDFPVKTGIELSHLIGRWPVGECLVNRPKKYKFLIWNIKPMIAETPDELHSESFLIKINKFDAIDNDQTRSSSSKWYRNEMEGYRGTYLCDGPNLSLKSVYLCERERERERERK